MVATGKIRKLLTEFFLFFIVLILLIFFVFLVKQGLMQLSKEIQNSILEQLEQQYTIHLSYRSLGPSLFATIDIRDLEIRSKEDNHPIIKVKRIRIGYSLFQLVRGNVIESFQSLRLEKPLIAIDMERDQFLLQRVFKTQNNQKSSPPSLIKLLSEISFKKGIQIRLINGELHFSSATTDFKVQQISLNGRVLKDEFQVKSKLTMVMLCPELSTEQISSSLEIQGALSLRTLSGSLQARLAQLKTTLFTIKTIGIQANFTSEKLNLYKLRDFLPYNFEIIYNVNEKKIEGSVEFADFTPNMLINGASAWTHVAPWLTATCSGSIQFNYTLGNDVHYKVSVNALTPFPWVDTRAQINISGIGSQIHIQDITLHSNRGTIKYSGDINLQMKNITGNVTIQKVLSPTNIPIDGTFTITTQGSDYYIFGESLTLGEAQFSAVDAHINQNGKYYTWDISALHFIDETSYENVRVARIFSDGIFDPSDFLFQGTFKIDGLELSVIYNDIVQAFIGSLPQISKESLEPWAATTELFVTYNGKHISYSSPRLILYNQNDNMAAIIASIAGTEHQINIQNGQILLKQLQLYFNSNLDFTDINSIKIDTNLTYEKVVYSVLIEVLDLNTITLQGSYGLTGSFIRITDGSWSGFCKSDTIPIPIESYRMLLSFDIDFKFLDPKQWNLQLHKLVLSDIPNFNKQPFSVSCTGEANPQGIQLQNVTYQDSGGILSGIFTASWEHNFTNIVIISRLSDIQNSERYEITLKGLASGELEGRFYVSRANLNRFYVTSFNPIFTGELRFIWSSIDNFSIDWKIASLKARLFDQDTLVSSSGSLSPEGLEISNTTIAYGDLQVDINNLELNRIQKTLSMNSRIRGILLSRSIDIYNKVDLHFSDVPTVQALLQQPLQPLSYEGSIVVTQGFYDRWHIDQPIPLAVTAQGGAFSFRGGQNNAIRAELGTDGAFYLAFSQPLPLRGAITGSLNKGMIDAKTNKLYVDVSALWGLLPKNFPLQITSGFATVTVDIKGPITDPLLYGTASASSVRMAIPDWIQEELGPTDVTITFQDTSMNFTPVLLPVGKGKASVKGSMIFERWLPSNYFFQIAVKEPEAILFKTDLLGIKAKGKTWGILDIKSEDGLFSVTGDLAVSETLIMYSGNQSTENLDIASPFAIESLITLRTGKKVEFIWPNTNFPILRAYSDLGSIIQIKSNSETRKYSVKGNVNLRGGEVFYFQRSFYIRSGQLTFNENEIRFDPRVALRAEIRDRLNSSPVIISLIIDNAPLSNFSPRFLSDPPLSQVDIFALLGQNVTGTSINNQEKSFQDAVLNASSDVIAQFNVVRSFEQDIRESLNLDMFSIRTQILQNTILQASGLVDRPVDRTSSLGNYFDNTTLYVGKYFGPDFFVHSMVSLRYNSDNENTLLGGLTIEPEIGAELRSPLFTINWNFVPKEGDRLFINSQSVTISWKWSF
ncbi:protein of unknown function DUF490 [Gracilinema caldarium DSM 7334]|uniref:Translocation and assembly module TamB C-terminal domain-containing protein n=1 Tax=Gracilinema caldarium (strain ATCC 51460 / DSM 7334 / H1) TaxID=744872 RepID=F8F2U8_GRAC1|nr:protein of unknown function DUF490 [Gracilinema caldarium DSM 7334]